MVPGSCLPGKNFSCPVANTLSRCVTQKGGALDLILLRVATPSSDRIASRSGRGKEQFLSLLVRQRCVPTNFLNRY